MNNLPDDNGATAAAEAAVKAKALAKEAAAEAKAAADEAAASAEKAEKAAREAKHVPNGYHQALVTAITIFITAGLLFLRFWAFEEKSEWTLFSIVVAVLIVFAIYKLCLTLFRAVKIEDDRPMVYEKTVEDFWFATKLLIVGVISAAFLFSGIFARDSWLSKKFPKISRVVNFMPQEDEPQSIKVKAQSINIEAQSINITTNLVQ